MASTTTSNDNLPASIPILDSSGGNWYIWIEQMTTALKYKEKWGHFDGSKQRPVAVLANPQVAADPNDPQQVTAAEAANVIALQALNNSTAFRRQVAQWDKDDNLAYFLLLQKIPPNIVERIQSLSTVREKWNQIIFDLTDRSIHARAQLRSEFQEMRCPRNGNVSDYLDNVRSKRNTIAMCGVSVSNDEYVATIVRGLPIALANYSAAALDAAEANARNIQMFSGIMLTEQQLQQIRTVDPELLIHQLKNEYMRRKRQNEADSEQRKVSKALEKPKDKAFSATDEEKKKKDTCTCYNCR